MSGSENGHPAQEPEVEKKPCTAEEEGFVTPTPLSPLVALWCRFVDFLQSDCFGLSGPEFIPQNLIVNLQKGGTLLWCLFLMRQYNNTSTDATVYTAMHGSYGIIWLLKELIFPDPKFSRRLSVFGAINSIVGVLAPYWLAPYLLISGKGAPQPQWRVGLHIIIYALGAVVMMGADCQKYFVLKCRKGLIQDGFFARVRHPNYLGEMMIYGSFAAQAGHWQPWAVLAWIWAGLFIPNMLQKEASMSRYAAWQSYKRKTGFLIPKIL